jgi:hypothetical protein
MAQFDPYSQVEIQHRVGQAQLLMRQPDDIDLAVSTLKAAVVGLQTAKEHKKLLATYIHLVESALDMVRVADGEGGRITSATTTNVPFEA